MDIATLCRRDVVAIDRAATLQDAARLMRERHVGALVVTTASPQGARVAGVVTDRDLAVDALARGLDGRTTTLADVACAGPVTVAAGADVSQAIATMRRDGVRRLLVVDDAQRLVGLVALDDVIEALAGDLGTLSHALRHGIEREATLRRPLGEPHGEPFDISLADELMPRRGQLLEP